MQKHNAIRRGIEFRLTYEEWLEIWGDKLPLRGRTKGCYVMARHGDQGAYEIGNVKIIPREENDRERMANMTPAQIEMMKEGGRKNKGRARPDLAERNRQSKGIRRG